MSEHRPRYTRIKPALLLCDLIISIGYLLPQIRYNQKFSCYVDSEILLLFCWQMINCSEKSIRTARKVVDILGIDTSKIIDVKI